MASPFSKPENFAAQGLDLRVAFHRNGSFDFGWQDSELGDVARRLQVLDVTQGVNHDFPRTILRLNLSPEWDADGVELAPAVKMGQLANLIPPDTRMVIYAEIPAELPGGGSETRAFLFDGYPKVQRNPFSGKQGTSFVDFYVIGMSLFERMGMEPGAWIYGRHMKAPPGAPEGVLTQHCAALPCIFNFDSAPGRNATRGNRAKNLIDIDGKMVPVFTYDGDPEAVWWTYADVLTYLLHFYHKLLGELYPLADGNGYLLCKDIVEADEGPQVLTTSTSVSWQEHAATKADEMTVQGLNVTQALIEIMSKLGACVMQHTRNEGGEPSTELVFWMAGEGGPFTAESIAEPERIVRTDPEDETSPVRALSLDKESTRAPFNGTANSEVMEGEAVYDASAVVSSCQVIGEPTLHEITTGKGPYSFATKGNIWKPAWKPDLTFGDDISGNSLETRLNDIADADPEATGIPLLLFQRYFRSGKDHALYAEVGRRWSLDESGELAAQAGEYARINGLTDSWSAETYAAGFDFHTFCNVPFLRIDNEDRPWVRRRRRMLSPLAVGADHQKQHPRVDCSWDSGNHWYPYPGNVRFEDDRCTLVLTDENLAGESLTNKADEATDATSGQSVWEAIMRGAFRLAVTFTVEGDAVVSGQSADAQGYTTFKPHRLLTMNNRYRHHRQETSSVLVGQTGQTFVELDETAQAEALANRCVSIAHARTINGNFVIPWLSRTYLPGDLISGIQPRGVSFDGNRDADHPRYPQVVGIKWHAGEDGPETHITLDDLRTAIRKSALENA